MPISPAEFWGALKRRGFTFFAGVPDSTFGEAYNAMIEDPEIQYVPAVREDVALGVASAAYFAGRRAGVVMQNSGVGNLVNPIASFSLVYGIPVLLIVGWRGYGGPANDAPEHWVMGAKTEETLDLFDIPHVKLEAGSLAPALDALIEKMDELSRPAALLVPRGVLS